MSREGAWEWSLPAITGNTTERCVWIDPNTFVRGTSSTSNFRSYRQVSRSGFRTRNWQWLQQRGQLAPANATYSKTVRETTQGAIYGVLTSDKRVWRSIMDIGGDPLYTIGYLNLPGTDSAVYNDAYMRLLQRVNAAEAECMQFIAEGRQTSKDLSSLVKRIDQSHDKYMKRTKEKILKAYGLKAKRKKWTPARLLDIASESWLEWSFGAKPLVSDVQDIARALAAIYNGRVTRRKVSASYQDRSRDSQNVTAAFGGGTPWGPNICDGVASRVSTRTIKLGGIIQSTDGQINPLNITGLRLENVFPSLWELTPWSWLVDYFSNIGDLIEAYSQPALAQVLTHAWKVSITEQSVELEFRARNQAGWTMTTPWPIKQNMHSFNWSRGPVTLSRPSLQFKSDLSLTRLCNMAAVGVLQRGRVFNSFASKVGGKFL